MTDNIPENVNTIPDDIIQQDLLLDDIKEYRKIINVLFYKIQQHLDVDDCSAIINEFENLLDIEPFNYDYEYSGYDNVLNEYHKHRKYIEEVMNRLKNSQNNICDELYNECFSSEVYRYYYLRTE